MLLARGDLMCRVWDGGVNACIWHRSSGSRERCRISGFIVSVEIDATVCVVVVVAANCRLQVWSFVECWLGGVKRGRLRYST